MCACSSTVPSFSGGSFPGVPRSFPDAPYSTPSVPSLSPVSLTAPRGLALKLSLVSPLSPSPGGSRGGEWPGPTT